MTTETISGNPSFSAFMNKGSLQTNYVRGRIAEIASKIDARSKTAIYGAGMHTQWLLKLFNVQLQNLNVKFILDDKPSRKELCGLEIIPTAKANMDEIDWLIVSSDAYEDAMASRLETLVLPQRVLRIYGDCLGKFKVEQAKPVLNRATVAQIFLKGQGIEIGALAGAQFLPDGVSARYVDRMTESELRRQYPELNEYPLVPVNVVDDGQTLATFAESSVDFVVANHFLEHCDNPILAIKNMLRVIKPGGTLFLAIPHKDFTFDSTRRCTLLSHLIDDFKNGPETSKLEHFRDATENEFIQGKLAEKAEDREEWIEKNMKRYLQMDYSIHFHVWTEGEIFELFGALKTQFNLPFAIELFTMSNNEMIIVMRKSKQKAAEGGGQ